MGMKYKDPSTGQLKELSLKAADTLPIGTIVDYDGEDVPEGWEEYGTDDYSTDEVFTGKHWIDGKPIYRKVISDITVTSNMSEVISTGLSNVNVISIYGEYHTANYDITQTVPYISFSKEYVIEVISMNSGANIRYRTSSAFNGKSNIVLEYTKNS